MKITKANYISQLAEQNPEAIEYIVLEYGDLIKTVLIRYMGKHKQYWEECFNDVLMAVWNSGGSFDETKGSFTSWICAVSKNKATDFIRREIRFDNKSAIQQDIAVYDKYKDENIIDELLECLNPDDKALFLEKYVYQNPVHEIAGTMGLKSDVIYSRLSRGKKKIRRYIETKGIDR